MQSLNITTASDLKRSLVSIPQAVGTIAMKNIMKFVETVSNNSFNTASGRYYCNVFIEVLSVSEFKKVSIPQAVGTIAMIANVIVPIKKSSQFQYRKR